MYPAEAGLIDRGGSCPTTSSIDNRQSAIGNENLVIGCGGTRCAGYDAEQVTQFFP
jgi:hypothetical protein